MIYQPEQVASIYTPKKGSCAAMQEAFTEGLPLVKICTGNYRKSRYIALTPNFHNLAMKEI